MRDRYANVEVHRNDGRDSWWVAALLGFHGGEMEMIIIIFNHDRKVAHGLSDIHGIAYRIIYALATMENNN